MMLANDKKQLFDCVITCGERDPKLDRALKVV